MGDFEIAADDPWRRCSADELAGDHTIVALSELADRAPARAVVVPGHTPYARLEPHLAQLRLICIEFPIFRDGRGYSLARRLRRAGFAGELRAVGHVLRDQLVAMHRVGFDSFELAEGRDAESARAAFGERTVFMQSSADDLTPKWRAR